MWTNLPRGVARCQHIKVNGTRCDSPALKGKPYCYFHFRSRISAESTTPSALPSADSQQPAANDWSPLSPPPDLFLLEDRNSIQYALQWVLRRILAASIDRRQAALLLYGLQIASANIKNTNFQPSYRHLIRSLPKTAETSEIAHQPAPNCPTCHPELCDRALAKEHNEGPAFSPSPTPAVPSLPGIAPQPSSTAEGQEPIAASPELAKGREPKAESPAADSQVLTPDSSQPTAAPRRPKRSRRQSPASPPILDRRMLASSPRAALSLMFQRELKRHLADLEFPNSPEPQT